MESSVSEFVVRLLLLESLKIKMDLRHYFSASTSKQSSILTNSSEDEELSSSDDASLQ